MKPNHTEQGFTLLEVLIALAVLLIGIGTVMQLMPISLLYARSAAEQTVASQAADSVLGEVRQMGAESLYYEEIPESILNFDKAAGFYGYSPVCTACRALKNLSYKKSRLPLNCPTANGRSL